MQKLGQCIFFSGLKKTKRFQARSKVANFGVENLNFKVEPRNISCLLHILAADRSYMYAKCIMAYQHMSARGVQYFSTT